jgi:hypothetical protein
MPSDQSPVAYCSRDASVKFGSCDGRQQECSKRIMSPALLIGIFCALVASVDCSSPASGAPTALARYLRSQCDSLGGKKAQRHRRNLGEFIGDLNDDDDERRDELARIMGKGSDAKELESFYRYDFLGSTNDKHRFYDSSDNSVETKKLREMVKRQGAAKVARLDAIFKQTHPLALFAAGDNVVDWKTEKPEIPHDVIDELGNESVGTNLRAHYAAFKEYLGKHDFTSHSFKNLRKVTEAALGCLHVDRKAAAFLTKLSELIALPAKDVKEPILYQALYYGQNTVSSRIYLFAFSLFWIVTCSLLVLFKEAQIRKEKSEAKV